MSMQSNFTPEHLIEAPRRTPLIPNHAGTHALYTVSTYSLAGKSEVKEVMVVDLATNQHSLFSDDPTVQNVSWLKNDSVLWTRSKDGGKVDLWTGHVGTASKRISHAGTIDAPISDIKTKPLPNDTIALVFCAAVKSDGTLLNPEAEPKSRTTAREFETVNLRYWAAWSKSYKQSLFYTTLEKTAEGDSYKLRAGPAINALLGTEINFPWTDAAPFGEGGQYDVSTTGIVLATLDPSVTPADFLLSEVWYVPLTTFTESPAPEVRLIKPSAAAACDGSSESPVFSPDGRKIAFLKGTDRKRLWHCPRRIFIASTDTTDDARLVKLLDPSSDGQDWDHWPGSLMWSNDAKTIYFDAEVRAYRRLFRIALPQEQDGGIAAKPMPLTETGSVVAMHRMGHTDTTLLLTLTSFIDSSTFVTLSSSSGDVQILSSASENGRLFGMSPSQVTQFTIPVADYSVQSWLITPPTMDPTRKYPLAISIHGGPQVGLLDAWSTRWNLLLLAAQGFVVLVPNFSGSSSFGEGFANVVDQGWGGRPYDDVVACFEHAVKEHSFIDADRVVAMGGSYGGYLVNWLAGQPFASRVRALVCHNGIWNLPGVYAGDVPSTLRYDLLGEWWENRQHWDKYDPAQYVQNWKTPMLFIHSDNDFRCPLEQGIAPFMICQARGIPSRFLNFPDENHWVLARENSLQWHRTVYGWINKYTENAGGIQLAPPISEAAKEHGVKREEGRLV